MLTGMYLNVTLTQLDVVHGYAPSRPEPFPLAFCGITSFLRSSNLVSKVTVEEVLLAEHGKM
jgi:hypothetical protein